MAGKKPRFRRKFKERISDALGHLLDVPPGYIGSPDCREEKCIPGEQHFAFLTVEANASLAMSGRVKNHEIGIEELVTILQEEVWLRQFRVQCLEHVGCMFSQGLEQRPVGVLALGWKVRTVAAVNANMYIEISFGVVVDYFFRGTRMFKVTMSEDDRSRDDVEYFQPCENFRGVGARIDQHALFLAGGNHVGICVEWTNDDTFDHTAGA